MGRIFAPSSVGFAASFPAGGGKPLVGRLRSTARAFGRCTCFFRVRSRARGWPEHPVSPPVRGGGFSPIGRKDGRVVPSRAKRHACPEASLIHRSFLAVPGGRAPVPAEQIAARSTPFWVSEGWIRRMVKIAFGDRPRGGLLFPRNRLPPVQLLFDHSQDGQNRLRRPAPGRADRFAHKAARSTPF